MHNNYLSPERTEKQFARLVNKTWKRLKFVLWFCFWSWWHGYGWRRNDRPPIHSAYAVDDDDDDGIMVMRSEAAKEEKLEHNFDIFRISHRRALKAHKFHGRAV